MKRPDLGRGVFVCADPMDATSRGDSTGHPLCRLLSPSLTFLSEEILFKNNPVGNGLFLLAKFPVRPEGPAKGLATLLACAALWWVTG